MGRRFWLGFSGWLVGCVDFDVVLVSSMAEDVSDAVLEVRMQSGQGFCFMGDVAEDVHRELQSDSSAPIVTPFGPAYSVNPIEVTMHRKYIESQKWHPNGLA